MADSSQGASLSLIALLGIIVTIFAGGATTTSDGDAASRRARKGESSAGASDAAHSASEPSNSKTPSNQRTFKPAASKNAKDSNKPGADKNTDTNGAPQTAAGVLDRVYKLVEAHRGGAPAQCTVPACPVFGAETEFVLATIPDPEDRPLALEFDRNIDALIAAAQNAAFQFDSQDLPWKAPDPDASTGDEHEHESRIGALLFRHPTKLPDDVTPNPLMVGHQGIAEPDPRPVTAIAKPTERERVLVILLIPETPTAGVDKHALSEAIGVARRAQPKSPVHILGPTYSGSAMSVESVLRQHIDADTGISFRVISGTATSFDVYKRLSTIPRTDFHATVLPDDVMQESMVHFLLNTLEVDPKDVALLVEQDSSYGQGIIDHSEDISRRRRATSSSDLMVLPFPMNVSSLRDVLERRDRGKDGANTTDALVGNRYTLELTLDTGEPTHIPRDYSPATFVSSEQILDNIISEINRDKFKYIGIAASQTADKIFLARRIRRFNPDLTIFFVESDILYANEQLTEEFYGSLVVATYPLFTRNQIWSEPYEGYHLRVQFPSGGAEGLYNATLSMLELREPKAVHRDDRNHYPLEYGGLMHGHLPRSWQQRLRAISFFRPLDVRDEDETNTHVPVPEYRPLVWITAIGRGYFWPLTTYYPYTPDFERLICSPDKGQPVSVEYLAACHRLRMEASSYVVSHAARTDAERHGPVELIAAPYTALLVLILVLLFTMIHGVGCYVCEGAFSNRTLRYVQQLLKPWWLTVAFRASQRGDKMPALMGAACLLVLLASASLLTRWFVLYPFLVGSPFLFSGWFYLVACVLYCVMVVSIGFGVDRIARRYWSPALRFTLVVVVVAISVTTLCVRYAGAYTLTRTASSWGAVAIYQAQVMFTHRVTDLWSGLSPALPVILFTAIAYAWCLISLDRARLNRHIDDAARFMNADGHHGNARPATAEALDSARAAFVRARQVLRVWAPGLRGWLPAAAILMWFALVLLQRIGPTFDGRLFCGVFYCCVVLATIAVAHNLLRLVAAWRAIRIFLGRLSSSALVNAFARVPHRFWRNLGTKIFAASHEDDTAELLDDYWRLLRNQLASSNILDKINDRLDGDGERAWLERVKPDWRKPSAWSVRREDEVLLFLVEQHFSRQGSGDGKLITESIRRAAERDGAGDVTETAAAIRGVVEDSVDAWLRLAEDYLALRFTALIDRLLAQARGMILFCTATLLLLLFAVNAYPFEPRAFMMEFVFVTGVLVVSSSVWVFFQINRDDVISRIMQTGPGETTWNWHFVSQLIVYAVIPIVSFVSTRYPAWTVWLQRLMGGYHGLK